MPKTSKTQKRPAALGRSESSSGTKRTWNRRGKIFVLSCGTSRVVWFFVQQVNVIFCFFVVSLPFWGTFYSQGVLSFFCVFVGSF